MSQEVTQYEYSFEIEDSFLEQLFAMSLDEDLFRQTFNLSKINLTDELNTRLDKIQKRIENFSKIRLQSCLR